MSANKKEPNRRRESGIDYKDVEYLSRFIGPQGQILSRRRSGFTAQRQKELKQAIKRARHLALMAFVG